MRPGKASRRFGPVFINESFRGQKTTGQQRYAAEIADRLARSADYTPLLSPPRLRESKLLTWLWSLTVMPWRARSGVLISMTSRAPVWHRRHVVVVHDLFVLTNPSWYSARYVRTHAPLLRATLRGAAAVAAVSEPVAEQVRDSGLTTAPVIVAPNAASVRFDPVARDSDRTVLDELDLSARHFLLAVGSIEPRKNLERLVAAFAALPEDTRLACPLVLVGGGSDVFRKVEFEQPEGVRATGYLSDEQLAALYRHSRGMVFPSLAEGFGLPIVEARRSGARVAASDIEVFRWIAGDEIDYFDPYSVESIRRTLLNLIEQEVRSDPGSSSTSGRFSWDSTADALTDLVETVRRQRT